MRSWAIGVVMSWGALGCGGVAIGGRDEQPPVVPEEDPKELPAAGGTGAVRPGSPVATGGSAVVIYDNEAGSGPQGSAGEPNVYVPGDDVPGDGDASCASPITRELSPFVAYEPDTGLSVQTQLKLARRSLIGDWHGVVTTPWVPQYQVTASFGEDGSYSASCDLNSDANTGGCCRAFYYGSDRDSELKRWDVSSVNADGSVDGNLDVAFCYDDPCYLPGWQGKLRNLHGDQSAQRIRFEFWRDDGYGPVAFDLERD